MSIGRLPILVSAILALQLAGPGAAQVEPAYEFRLESDEFPIEGYSPMNQSFDRHAVLVVKCLAPHGASPVPREFAFSATVNREGVSVAVSPATVLVPLDAVACASGEPVKHNVTVSLAIAPEVRAALGIEIDLMAEDQDGRTEHLVWKERAGPIIRSDVRFVEDRFKAGPNNQLSLPLDLRNEGNANLQFQFSLDEWSSNELNVALPPPVIVDVESGQVMIPVDIQTPFENGYLERVDLLSLNVTRVWVDDPSFKDNLGSINATIETVGTYIPGPSAVVAGAVLVGFLAVAARRRPMG